MFRLSKSFCRTGCCLAAAYSTLYPTFEPAVIVIGAIDYLCSPTFFSIAFDAMAMSRLLVLTIILLAKGASAGKIIALPLCGAPSHVFIVWKVCRELTARGHAIKVQCNHSSIRLFCVLNTCFTMSDMSIGCHDHIYTLLPMCLHSDSLYWHLQGLY